MASDNESSEANQGHALTATGLFTDGQIALLAQRWITTTEQFVAAVAAEDARKPMAALLEISPKQLGDLLDQLRKTLGDEAYNELMTPSPDHPTGVLMTDEQKKKFTDPERAVLFFDEVEWLLEKRGNRKINTVTQFLAMTDGIVKSKNCMLLLAATNKPWRLDEAAVRPGRLGTHVYVGLPDASAREAIVAHTMKDIPVADEVDFAALSARTEGYSGADVAEICKRAKKVAIRRQLQSGQDEKVTAADFEDALGKVQRSVTKDNLQEFEAWRDSRDQPAGDTAADE